MGVFVPAVNTAQFALLFHDLNGDTQENVLWVKRSIAWDSAALAAMASALETWYITGNGTHAYCGTQSYHITADGIGYRDNTTQHGLTGVYQTGYPRVGGNTNPLIEPGLTKSITARTGLAGKSFRGRTFLIGLSSTAVSNAETGQIDATVLADYLLAFNALPGAVTAADADCLLVVCSRFYQPGGPKTPTIARATAVLTPITSYGYHDLNLDFQRRRAPGHGRHG
jgi:hypothetical protein